MSDFLLVRNLGGGWLCPTNAGICVVFKAVIVNIDCWKMLLELMSSLEPLTCSALERMILMMNIVFV